MLREIERFPSSTEPARVLTDVGQGFIKSMGNRHGDCALVCELVAAELGSWFGLNIPPFAVVNTLDIEIMMERARSYMQAPLFFSSAIDGSPFEETGTYLTKLKRSNDIAKLVFFDTWLLNRDRCSPGMRNWENLIFSLSDTRGKYDLVPIDHTHCILWDNETEFFNELASVERVEDAIVYGKFPSFVPYLDTQTVTEAATKLSQLDRNFVVEIVNSIPPQWGIGDGASEALVKFVCERAQFVAETLPAKLINDPQFIGV